MSVPAPPSPPSLTTARLRLRHLREHDAPFILELLGDPEVILRIGDRGVHTTADAKRYIADGPAAMYREHQFGLQLVETRPAGIPTGICGLVRRPTLELPDLGFAFLPAHRGRGYATEAAAAVLEDAAHRLRLPRVLAITAPGNAASQRVLEKLGFEPEGSRALGDDTTASAVFSLDLRSFDRSS